MTLADRTIEALRAHHDELSTLVAGLTPDQLGGPSGAAEWTLADVLSHLGSGAEITIGPLLASVAGDPAPEQDNEPVWARWNALAPEEQAVAFVEHDQRLVSTLEELDAGQRQSLTVDLGFLPQPVSLETYAGMRLGEVAAHAWDVHVGIDPTAEVREDSAAALVEHFAGGLGFLLGFAARPDALAVPAGVALDGHVIVIEDTVRVLPAGEAEATATFTGPVGAGVRLLSGRLGEDFTPAGVEVTGNVGLDELRRVFPGY